MTKKEKGGGFYEIGKRVIDVVGSIALIVFFSPVMIFSSTVLYLTSPGPILVERKNSHMRRLGKDGKVFRLLKFRSMMVGADYLEKFDPKYKHVYIQKHTGGSYKPKNDPRITPFGKFIRKHSVDEMPQLFNVLKGEMSIVGPRAYLKEELKEQLQKYPKAKKYVKEVMKIKPGITGYWQVSGRSEVNFDKRIEMDAYYARRRSLLFDILIMLKTPWAMISGKGAV